MMEKLDQYNNNNNNFEKDQPIFIFFEGKKDQPIILIEN